MLTLVTPGGQGTGGLEDWGTGGLEDWPGERRTGVDRRDTPPVQLTYPHLQRGHLSLNKQLMTQCEGAGYRPQA